MDTHVKFGDSAFKGGGELFVSLPVGPGLSTYVQYSIAVLQPTGSSCPRHIQQLYVADSPS